MTNYFAIVITGIVVFSLMGYSRTSLAPQSSAGRRFAIALILGMVILVAIPLGFQSRAVARSMSAESRAADATRAWVAGTQYEYRSARASQDMMTITVVGTGALPPQQTLRDSLAGRLDGMTVHVDAVPAQTMEFETSGGG